MHRRLRIARHWLSGSRHGVTASGLFGFLTGPRCQTIAAREIVGVEEDGDALRVRLRGMPFPLLFPKEMNFYHLQQVIAESHNASDWHYYEIDETRVRAGDVVADCGAPKGCSPRWPRRVPPACTPSSRCRASPPCCAGRSPTCPR
jgi:hypothetical protein